MHIKVNFSPSVPTAKIILQCKFLYFLLVCTLNVVIVLSCRLCKCVICTVKWTRTCTVKYWNLSQYRKKTCTIVFKVHNIEIEFLLENIQMYSISFEIFSVQFRAQPIYKKRSYFFCRKAIQLFRCQCHAQYGDWADIIYSSR